MAQIETNPMTVKKSCAHCVESGWECVVSTPRKGSACYRCVKSGTRCTRQDPNRYSHLSNKPFQLKPVKRQRGGKAKEANQVLAAAGAIDNREMVSFGVVAVIDK